MASSAPNKNLKKEGKGAGKSTEAMDDLCRGANKMSISDEYYTDEEESGGSKVDSVEVTEENLYAILKKICNRLITNFQGNSESVYKKALIIKLEKLGIKVESEKPMSITYYGKTVGTRKADVILTLKSNSKVILELKAVQTLTEDHYNQLLYYMNCLKIQRGFLINFPPCGKFPKVKPDRFKVVRGDDIVMKMKGSATSSVARPAEIVEVEERSF